MANLRSRLADLTSSFTDGVIDAIRSTSLEELLSESRTRPRAQQPSAAPQKASPKSSKPASGRLARRSADDIAAELDKIVALVAKNKEGLRAEQIRAELGMQAKELPRVLKEGIMTKRLRARGQKRATTYFSK